MANLFLNIPVPAANGVGAAVDVSAMGKTKSFVIGGGFRATVNVEYATDLAGTVWAPLATFHQSGNLTIDVACHWLRAVTSEYLSGAPNLDVGANDAGTSFALLTADGASVDVSALPAFKTVVTPNDFAGTVELSEDGVSWAQIFSFQDGGGQSREIVAQFARVIGNVNGIPTDVYLGGSAESSGGGSSAAVATRPPGEVFDYLEDFMSGTAPAQFFTNVTGTATVSHATSNMPWMGVETLVMNNPGDTGYVYIGNVNTIPDETKFTTFQIEWGGAVDLAPTTNDFTARYYYGTGIGSGTIVGGNFDCIAFVLGIAQNGNANWHGVLNDATKVDLGVPCDTNYHRFKALWTAGVGVEFFIDDVLRGTIAGTPTINTQIAFCGFNIQAAPLVGAQPDIDADYIWMHVEMPRP